MMPILEVNNLTKIYQDKLTQIPLRALDRVSLTINENEIVGVMGESGCGKSTLLKHLVALEEADEGTIDYRGRRLRDWIRKDHRQFRRQVQMIFQNPYEVFDRRQTIAEILLQGLRIHRIGNNLSERLAIILSALEEAGFQPAQDYLDRYSHELSGGQIQRISILRSLLLGPKLIIADEPVSMLDVSIRAEVLDMLYRASRQNNNSMLIVSHDILTLSNIADRLIVMYQGQIVEMIASNQLYDAAEHPYTKVLISNALGKEVSHDVMQEWIVDFDSRYRDSQQNQMVEINAGHYVSSQKNLI